MPLHRPPGHVGRPSGGTVAQVNVAPGSYVEQGERLFHLVDRRRLWLEARIAESDLASIRQPTGAWFRAPGFDGVFEIGTGGARAWSPSAGWSIR